MLAELVERGRADALQLAACQRRFDDVARVDRAFGGARADERVELVDEQDDLAARAADLIHDALHALFELAAILRAGHQAREIERDDAFVAQQLGHVAVDDALRQALGDRRLADAGLADERGIVLGAPREDLHDAFDLGVAADDRIELALAGELREIAAVRVERRRLALAFGRGLRLRLGTQQRGRLHAHFGRVDAKVGEHARRDAFAFADQAEQQVLRADVIVVELARLFESQFDDALGPRGEHHLLLHGLAAAPDDRLDFGPNLRQVDS